MMEKRAPRMMETSSLFEHEDSFTKMARLVKTVSGNVSTKKNELPAMIQPTPYKQPDFSFMNKGNK
jgi:hypothetical protein